MLNSEKEIQKLQDELRKLKESITAGTIGKAKDNENVRIVKDGNGAYQLEVKHNDGWVKSDSASTTGFSLKNK